MKVHHAILQFLDAIQEHNSRKYFASVKDLYDEIWENMQEVAGALIGELAKIDPDYAELKPKECLFRIYRDARRIKDGDPIYKNNFGIVICSTGKKSDLPAFYLHIQGGNKSFFGGGLYWPESQHLFNLRSYLKKHGNVYKKLVGNKAFKKYFGEVHGSSLTKPPKGFQSYDPYLEIIMKKQHLMYSPLSDKELTSVDIVQRCMERIKASKEWIDFLTTGCETKAK